MSDRLHIATRKGLFTYERKGNGPDTWKIVNTAFLGDPVSNCLEDPRDGALYAALNLGHFGTKLQRSGDGGRTWTEVAVPAFPKDDNETATRETEGKAPSLDQIWTLEPGNADQPGLLWAGCVPAGLFRSEDRGESWDLVTSLWDRPERKGWFGGGTDHPGMHSVLVDPRGGERISVGISCGGMWQTRDGGETWELRAQGMRAAYMPPDSAFEQNIQDPHRIVRCPADPDMLWTQHHNGVFRSKDNGASWTELTNCVPANFGFGVAVHPRNPETVWLVPGVKDECRIPVDGKVVVSRTRNGGTSWEVLRTGLPQEHAYDIVFRHALDIDDTGDRLAMGSTTGNAWITEDQGDTWHALSTTLPPVYALRFSAGR